MKKDSNGFEDSTIIVLNEQGEEIECDVIFTFDNEETGKSYIVYTDNTTFHTFEEGGDYPPSLNFFVKRIPVHYTFFQIWIKIFQRSFIWIIQPWLNSCHNMLINGNSRIAEICILF